MRDLDLSNHPALIELDCIGIGSAGLIKTIDLSGDIALERLNCNANQISQLDLSGCPSLKYLHCNSMPTLGKVCVWVTPFPPANLVLDTAGSPNIIYSTDCSN
jgi:hypothetical protein